MKTTRLWVLQWVYSTTTIEWNDTTNKADMSSLQDALIIYSAMMFYLMSWRERERERERDSQQPTSWFDQRTILQCLQTASVHGEVTNVCHFVLCLPFHSTSGFLRQYCSQHCGNQWLRQNIVPGNPMNFVQEQSQFALKCPADMSMDVRSLQSPSSQLKH